MKRIFLILFCTNLFAQQTKLPMNISEVISLENPTYTVPAGYILQTLPLGIEEDPFDGTTQPGTVGVNDGVSGGWWSLEKIILTEGHKISSSISAGALLYDLGSLKANVKAFKVLWYDESYTIPENTVAEIYSVYSAGINGNPSESKFRKANETEDKALIEGMVLSEGTSIKSWGVISIIEYYENYSNNEIGVLSFVPEAGNVGVRLSSANNANHGNIGNNAVDLSYQSSTGSTTGATGDSSVAFGENTTASGYSSFAAGVANVASGSWGSTALGSSSVASGLSSVAIGDQVDATGNHSTAMGFFTTASGHSSTALGYGSKASGKYGATALGSHTTAIGHTSTAIGNYTTAEDIYSFVIGVHNNTDETPNPESFSYQNTAFVIGNGGHDSDGNYVGTPDTFSNAFEVLFDGTTTIAGDLNVNSDKKVFFGNQSFIEGATEGTVLILNANNNILFRPGGTTTVNFEPNGDAIFNGDVKVTSDKRLKANIVSLGATLSKLLQIDGKSYIMKKDEREKRKIGVLAQDIEKVFPELVSESNGIKSVNYQGLVPVLINALKEQQVEIDELKAIVTKLITP